MVYNEEEVIVEEKELYRTIRYQVKGFSWIECILKNEVQLPQIDCRYFSHVIKFEDEDEEVLN